MLAKSWPDFFDIMETDLARGATVFMDAGYRYLMARPPKEFFARPSLEPGDFAVRIVAALAQNDCRRLRQYRDQGKPFLAWFRRVATRMAIDIVRQDISITGPLVYASGNSDDDDDDILGRIESPPVVEPDDWLGDAVRSAIRSFGAHYCHRILWMRYVDEYSNQEISRRCPEGWSNVEVGNRFRRCRLRLLETLANQGITPDNLLHEAKRRPRLG